METLRTECEAALRALGDSVCGAAGDIRVDFANSRRICDE